MKAVATIVALLALASTASAAVLPSVRQQPCTPPAPAPWTPTLPTPPAPWQPTPPAPAPWTPPPPGSVATLTEDEGIVTATAGDKACTLTEELPEEETLPAYATVTTYQWGVQYAMMRTLPAGKAYSCKLEVAEED